MTGPLSHCPDSGAPTLSWCAPSSRKRMQAQPISAWCSVTLHFTSTVSPQGGMRGVVSTRAGYAGECCACVSGGVGVVWALDVPAWLQNSTRSTPSFCSQAVAKSKASRTGPWGTTPRLLQWSSIRLYCRMRTCWPGSGHVSGRSGVARRSRPKTCLPAPRSSQPTRRAALTTVHEGVVHTG